ncbi:MAG: ammonium transporter, partial [Acidimicrobiales bacterium]|nr:ammonium transporter [Acidimicrobiales bacterium]
MESGDYAWMLTATALVVFMVPGLALFYGGMVRSRNVLNMLMMNLACIGIVPIVWVLISYSLGNSPDGSGFFGGDWIGSFDNVGLKGLNGDAESLVFVAFLMTFASITPALISGAVADRMRFSAWLVFVPIWLLLVYTPVTYWVYSGWQHGNGALDFAGGTAIHLNAGVAALAVVLVLGRRRGWPSEAMPPHNVPMVLIGTGILWFGWFGFNAGSAGAANEQAVQALLNTFLGASGGMVGWLVTERLRGGRPTTLGACSGVVAGLVAITPAAGYVGGMAGIVFGFVAGGVCFLALSLKTRFGFDDSLDVVAVHGVGGLTGGLLLGLFADASAIPGGDFDDGLFFGGGIELFLDHVVAMGSVIVFSFAVTWVLAKALDASMGLRVDQETEQVGLDQTDH